MKSDPVSIREIRPLRKLDIYIKTPPFWERLLLKERSVANRILVGFFIASIGFALVFALHHWLGLYFASVIILSAILISLYSGIFIGMVLTGSIALLADYLFIAPLGTVLTGPVALDHFIIVTGIGLLTCALISSLRSAFVQANCANLIAEGRWTAEAAKREAELAKEALEELNRKLQRQYKLTETIVENLPIPLFLKDASDNFRIKLWNKAAEDLFGIPKGAIVGKVTHDLFPKEHADLYHADDTRVTASGIRVDIPEEPALSKTRGEVLLHTIKIPICLANDGMNFLLAICEDITQRKATEKALVEAKQAAVSSNLAKSAFLANMSHEIRTPLGAIMGFSELIVDARTSQAEKTHYISVIRRNGELLANIINDILDLSKVEAGKLSVDIGITDLQEVLKDTVALLDLQAKEKGVALRVSVDENVPAAIRTDPIRLRQILMNIAGNAIKFTAKGSVEILVKQDFSLDGEQKLSFTVSDTGKGIDQAEQEKLFAPFSQAHLDSRRRFGGTGLGLALSKHLANLLGGDVVLLQTEVKRGSSFKIIIHPGPIQAPFYREIRQDKSNASPLPYSGGRLDGIKVLLADDDLDNQELISHNLELAGAKVEIASNGQEAVEKAQRNRYDLLLMDIQMPIMDGYQATASLRGEGYLGNIVALTAHAMRDEKERCLASGFDWHISKPINFAILIEKVRIFSQKIG